MKTTGRQAKNNINHLLLLSDSKCFGDYFHLIKIYAHFGVMTQLSCPASAEWLEVGKNCSWNLLAVKLALMEVRRKSVPKWKILEPAVCYRYG